MADEQARRERTPWLQLTAIGLVALYAILFIVLNTHRAKVSFVWAAARRGGSTSAAGSCRCSTTRFE